jgi:hypothetical protein
MADNRTPEQILTDNVSDATKILAEKNLITLAYNGLKSCQAGRVDEAEAILTNLLANGFGALRTAAVVPTES